MSQLSERIDRFRKMATDDPDNELGHFRLGQLLLEDRQFADAAVSFRRTLELSPFFSKVYHLLAQTLLESGDQGEALVTLRKGYEVADERGDLMPRDDMAKLLVQLGDPAPVSKRGQTAGPAPAGTGFRCARPTCMAGARARALDAPPFSDDQGRRIQSAVCADCWTDWVKNYSIKVINELRLDLSTEHGQREYDRYMMEFLGLE